MFELIAAILGLATGTVLGVRLQHWYWTRLSTDSGVQAKFSTEGDEYEVFRSHRCGPII